MLNSSFPPIPLRVSHLPSSLIHYLCPLVSVQLLCLAVSSHVLGPQQVILAAGPQMRCSQGPLELGSREGIPFCAQASLPKGTHSPPPWGRGKGCVAESRSASLPWTLYLDRPGACDRPVQLSRDRSFSHLQCPRLGCLAPFIRGSSELAGSCVAPSLTLIKM